MADKLTANFAYTDAELLALWREADAKLAAGAQDVTIMGERITRADADKITAKIRFYESRVNASTGIHSNLGRYRRDP